MKSSDPRTGDLLGTMGPSGLSERQAPSFVIIGCPVDEGVIRNNGRAGASGAPELIRKYLNKMTPPAEDHDAFIELVQSGRDLGDIASAGMEQMQENLAGAISPWLKKKVPLIVIGGGHETTFGHYLGYRRAGIPHRIVNLDAHADVRPLKQGAGHSGSPFRQIMQEPDTLCRSYDVLGLQPQATAREHLDFVRKFGDYAYRDQTDHAMIERYYSNSEGNSEGTIMATFDMDAVDQSQAPGVSAPCPHGISKTIWLDAAGRAGANPAVGSMDLVEVNPKYDRDEQTSRLGALTIWRFLCGLTIRR